MKSVFLSIESGWSFVKGEAMQVPEPGLRRPRSLYLCPLGSLHRLAWGCCAVKLMVPLSLDVSRATHFYLFPIWRFVFSCEGGFCCWKISNQCIKMLCPYNLLGKHTEGIHNHKLVSNTAEQIHTGGRMRDQMILTCWNNRQTTVWVRTLTGQGKHDLYVERLRIVCSW